MQRIAIDMDEVMADAVSEHLRRYNLDFDENLKPSDLTGGHIWDAVQPDRHPALEAHLRSPDFFAVLGIMPEAQRVVRALQKRYEVFIATAAMEVPTSFVAKYEWLGEHFPFIPSSNIVFCGDKSVIRADFLIDDNPRQLRRFEGQGILFSAPHNVSATGFRRVENWLDVEKMFLS